MSTESPETSVKKIADGYDFGGAALDLGAVVVGDKAFPNAPIRIPLATLNRHGLVAGATGTGKTKTLQVIAEQLSAAGVPVLMADVKGDLSGLSKPGDSSEKIAKRAEETGDKWEASGFPVEFLSLGTKGIGVPVRASIASFGPILLSKVLRLNATQESTLGLIFHWAEQKNLPLVRLKDLRAVISYLTSDLGKTELTSLGGVSAQSAGVILRSLVNLESEGADTFFGKPDLDPNVLLNPNDTKPAKIWLLELGDQAARPVLFSTFLMWMLSNLFKSLPEVGDVDKPKLVFVFDEAHLLFADASKAFLDQVEQTVKLIRSRGVGVFFCTQLPTDVPNDVLSQLGARIQHALRAFTPDDQKALTKTVRTYPKTDTYDLASALTSLGIGEAIVTVLSERGAPTPVAWTRLRSPRSLMAAVTTDEIKDAAKASALQEKYGTTDESPAAAEQIEEIVAKAKAEAEANKPAAKQSSKSAPAQAKKESWLKGYLRSREGRSMLNKLFGLIVQLVTKRRR